MLWTIFANSAIVLPGEVDTGMILPSDRRKEKIGDRRKAKNVLAPNIMVRT